MTEDDALDRAIDETARVLTSGAPSHALRARVVERIERSPVVLPWAWRTAAAVAVFAVLTYAFWPTHESSREPAVIATAPAASAPAAVGPSSSRREAIPSPPERYPEPVSPRRNPRIRIDPAAPQIAALVEVNELSVPVAQPRDLDVPGLSVADVTIPPLEPGDKERR